MSILEKKIAVITGGGGAIGAAAAKLFVSEGAKVLLVDINEEACRKAVSAIGSEDVTYAVADVTKSDQVQAYVQAAMNRYGRIDIFLDNAGIEGVVAPIHEYPENVYRKVMEVNVIGVFLGLKYVIPAMMASGGGSCIISSSVAGIKGSPAMSAYSTSKHALIGLMKSAAIEYGPFNIRVNCINPAGVESRMQYAIESGYAPLSKALTGEELTREEVHSELLSKIPLQRYATVEDVAKVMLFLASDESRFCTGAFYMVDGGFSAY
jgi:NAD(P)-dependent dehydrogenase (short-subunit alcohol dehydrogenase family)